MNFPVGKHEFRRQNMYTVFYLNGKGRCLFTVHQFCLCYLMYDMLNSAYGSSVYAVSNDTVIENNELAREWNEAVAA